MKKKNILILVAVLVVIGFAYWAFESWSDKQYRQSLRDGKYQELQEVDYSLYMINEMKSGYVSTTYSINSFTNRPAVTNVYVIREDMKDDYRNTLYVHMTGLNENFPERCPTVNLALMFDDDSRCVEVGVTKEGSPIYTTTEPSAIVDNSDYYTSIVGETLIVVEDRFNRYKFNQESIQNFFDSFTKVTAEDLHNEIGLSF